jgi:protein-tyrosine phosphatase
MPNIKSLEVFQEALKTHAISHVVILCEPHETNVNLKQFYQEANVNVIAFPIKDFSIPPKESLQELVTKVISIAQKPEQNILIHCKAGIGRTGLVLTCFAMERFSEKNGKDARDWVREFVPGAVESPSQNLFVQAYREPVSTKVVEEGSSHQTTLAPPTPSLFNGIWSLFSWLSRN